MRFLVESLAQMQLRAIDFLHEVAQPYQGQVPAVLYSGIVAPRGNAYELSRMRQRFGLPHSVSFTLDNSTSRLASAPTLKQAIEVGDPAQPGEFMGGLVRQYLHIDMWGGCCGTRDTHLDAIARNVHTTRDPVPVATRSRGRAAH